MGTAAAPTSDTPSISLVHVSLAADVSDAAPAAPVEQRRRARARPSAASVLARVCGELAGIAPAPSRARSSWLLLS